MNAPKRMPNGQVVQENMEVSGMEKAPTNAPQGDRLQMQMIDGKSGSVETKGAVQTDHTHQAGGPAPETSAKSL